MGDVQAASTRWRGRRGTLRPCAAAPASADLTPEHLVRVVASDSAKYARLVKELNIKFN